MAKTTTVTLNANGVGDYDFEISHAERILRIPNTVWRLADKNFEWIDNALQRRRIKEKGDK